MRLSGVVPANDVEAQRLHMWMWYVFLIVAKVVDSRAKREEISDIGSLRLYSERRYTGDSARHTCPSVGSRQQSNQQPTRESCETSPVARGSKVSVSA